METVVVEARICEVEVYRSGCTIIMRGVAALDEGQNHVVLPNLPLDVDETSVSLRMPAIVQQGQVRIARSAGLAPSEDDELSSLDQRLTEIDRSIGNKQLELNAWRDLASKMSGPAALEFLEKLPPKLEELSAAIAALNTERQEVQRLRDKRQDLVLRPQFEADLSVDEAANLPFELSFRVRQAGWTPSYDVLANASSDVLSLRMKAEVWQETGDDWTDVKLRLSTGTTSVLGAPPQFVTRYLSKVAPAPVAPRPAPKASARRMVVSDSFGMAAPMKADAAFEPDMPLVEVGTAGASVEEQGTTVTYELADLQSVPNGSKPQTLTVTTAELPARYHHYAYPRKLEAAYLVAHLDSAPSSEVAENPLSVYLDGSYAGTVRIATSSGDDGYDLPLGRDELVRVHRTESVHRSKSLLGKAVREHESRISVENNRSGDVTVVVVEQVPVSRDKEIEVVTRDLSGATLDAERGELRWECTMAAGERKTLLSSYVITSAKGVTIYEEERRKVGERDLDWSQTDW